MLAALASFAPPAIFTAETVFAIQVVPVAKLVIPCFCDPALSIGQPITDKT